MLKCYKNEKNQLISTAFMTIFISNTAKLWVFWRNCVFVSHDPVLC